jgi:hypothetical protein
MNACSETKVDKKHALEKSLDENSCEEDRNLVLRFGELLPEWRGERVAPVIPGMDIIKTDESLVCNIPQEVFDVVYENMESNIHHLVYFIEHAILCSTNETTNKQMRNF